jgi:hypothetical protein
MSRRRVGRAGARALATAPGLDAAIATLARSPYGHDLHPEASLARAQRAVHETLLWNVRVLGGWVPRDGSSMLRVLLAPFEIANVADHLRRLAGEETPEPYRLGSLGTAWPRLARTTSPGALRRGLATSAWGDPGGESATEVLWSMRMALADRAVPVAPQVAPWAGGAVALLLARVVGQEHGELPPAARTRAARVVGERAVEARSLTELRAALPSHAAWALAGTTDAGQLWQAECRWWARVERDADGLARGPGAAPGVVVGVVALMAVDAWRVRAALEVATRGGAAIGVFDAVA